MGLDSLKNEIAREADAEARKRLAEADRLGHEAVKAAEKEAALREKSAEKEAEELLKSEKAERIAAARLEAKKIIAEGREEAMKESLEKVWQELAKLPKGREYPSLLKALVKKGIEEVGSGSRVYARKEDRQLVKELGAEVADKAIECAGGVIVESRDGKVRANLTLEQIFEEKKDDARKEIYGKLFG